MESDAAVNENLRLQFRALQEQQQKRLQRLMERKREKYEGDRKPDAFGVQDQLNLLQTATEASQETGSRLLEDENEQLQGQIRELQDENGRLHKLLKEKEFEIKHLRKKVEDNKIALAGTAGLSGDVAATKIVELSKKNRELTAEMEREKSKVRQLGNRVKELERELQNSHDPEYSGKDSGSEPKVSRSAEGTPTDGAEMKALQDRLAAANLKLTEYRNQIQTTRQEMKMAHKVLVSEVGEDVNILQLLSSAGGWRGRAQQILVLQGRVRELESQLGQARSPAAELSLEEEMLGISVPKRLAAQDKNLFRIRNLEKEKKETLERLTGEHDALKKDYEELKKKFEGSKARNKSLSNDLKSLKMQMVTLLEKGKHDDELIDALLGQQKNLQEILNRLSQQEQKQQDSQQTLSGQLNSESQKQNSLVTQLKQMVAEREAKVKELEEEVQQLTLKSPPEKQMRSKSFDTKTASEERRSEILGPLRSLSDSGDSLNSARTVSKLGHELVETATASSAVISTRSSPRRCDSSELRVWQTQAAEFRALCQAAEVERDRLVEFVSVLQKRAEESSKKALEAEKKLQEERKRSVLLEQQLEKLKMEAGKNGMTQKLSARGKAAQSLSTSRHFLNEWSELSSNVPPETQIEELSTKLAIQVDENDALKMALKNALKTKEDDLRLYHDMITQVKQIFLQALRQYKQERGAL
ncbi:coiled-coil domain-containing protein 13 [Bufo gargarizans]|uniref:coiled-coil domain-containing protein 13 n=1 Tax=Bufo gargarizans TaxID=30331 RepID=UPI001CF18F4C|nr:coiled-coil domain-containing protein 13 [Bufo gargarizans]